MLTTLYVLLLFQMAPDGSVRFTPNTNHGTAQECVSTADTVNAGALKGTGWWAECAVRNDLDGRWEPVSGRWTYAEHLHQRPASEVTRLGLTPR